MAILLPEKISLYMIKALKKYKLPVILKFNKKLLKDIDIIFTALPNGEAQKISKISSQKNTLIDLAADFRLEKASEYLNGIKKNIKLKIK